MIKNKKQKHTKKNKHTCKLTKERMYMRLCTFFVFVFSSQFCSVDYSQHHIDKKNVHVVTTSCTCVYALHVFFRLRTSCFCIMLHLHEKCLHYMRLSRITSFYIPTISNHDITEELVKTFVHFVAGLHTRKMHFM